MQRSIDRRTMLKAAGVSLTLPLLESMTPALAGKVGCSSATVPPKRSVFICTALGLHPPHLWPTTPGTEYESTPYLEPLADHRADFTLFSGLQHEDQTGRQPHDSELTWLTAARKPGSGGFRNSISVDQVIATSLGHVTRFPSITLGTMKTQSQSYTSGGVMIPAETSPAKLFAQLFLAGRPSEVLEQKRKLNDGKSILDELGEQSNQLRRRASSADNHLLDDYFESVRSAESSIGALQDWIDRPKPEVDAEPPRDIANNADLVGRIQLLMDLVPLVVQTDSSRVISIMIQDHYVVPVIDGVSGNHHNLSHHGQDPSKIEQLEKIELEILRCFAGLLTQMKDKQEAGKSLLDHTSILFGSNLGNANAHSARNLPIFLAGGEYDHGRYVARADDTPLSNLFLSLMHEMGVEADSFGQSSGTLSW